MITVIANQSGSQHFSTDLNNALAAIRSVIIQTPLVLLQQYAYQWWADTSAGVLKIRNSSKQRIGLNFCNLTEH